jgi:hypothetical protein
MLERHFVPTPMLVLGLLCGLAACGDSTGVDDIPDIGGDWTYNLTFSGGGLSCTYDPSAVSISQTGATFTGRIEIPDATCTFQGGAPYSLGDWGADIVNGTVNAAGAVTFDWGSSDTVHHIGTASASAMSGSASGDDGNNSVTGTWTATR